MTKPKLIEKLELLATYFILASSDANEQIKVAEKKVDFQGASFSNGRKQAYNTAFKKIDALIKEAKR